MDDVDFAVLLHHLKWDLFPSSNDKECNIDSPLFSEVLVEVIMDSEDSCVGYQSPIANANAM